MSNLIFHGDSLMGLLKKAKSIIFDNTGTGLTATNTQDAITEINSNLSELNNGLTSKLNYKVVNSVYVFKPGNDINNYYDITGLVERYNPIGVIPVLKDQGHFIVASVGQNGSEWYLSYISKNTQNSTLSVNFIIIY